MTRRRNVKWEPVAREQNSQSNDGFDYLKGLNVPDTRGTSSTPETTQDPWLSFLQSQLANFSTSSPGGYLGQAKGVLGELDLSALDQLRKAYEATYATNKGALDTSYGNLMESLGDQQKETAANFAQSRATISENAFGRGRDMYRNLAARGLGASGLQQLGDVQNRMATGREVSQAAGQYYDTSEKIADAKEQGTQSYNTQQQGLSNNLQASLAGVAQQEMQYRNQYQQQLAEMAMQLQQSALAQQNSKFNIESQLAQYQSQKYNDTKAKTSEVGKMQIVGNSDMSDVEKAAIWADTFGVPIEQATADMQAYDKQFSEKLRAEAFSKYDAPLKTVTEMRDLGAIVSDLKKGIESGAFTSDHVREFISKNYRQFANQKAWGGVDVFDPRKLAISMAINSNRDKKEIIEAMLDYFKIK